MRGDDCGATRNLPESEVVTSGENLAYRRLHLRFDGGQGRDKHAPPQSSTGCCGCRRQYGLDASDSVMQKTPYSFDVSVWEFFWPLMSGARLVLARAGGHLEAGIWWS